MTSCDDRFAWFQNKYDSTRYSLVVCLLLLLLLLIFIIIISIFLGQIKYLSLSLCLSYRVIFPRIFVKMDLFLGGFFLYLLVWVFFFCACVFIIVQLLHVFIDSYFQFWAVVCLGMKNNRIRCLCKHQYEIL